jgi:hypothetical protein
LDEFKMAGHNQIADTGVAGKRILSKPASAFISLPALPANQPDD